MSHHADIPYPECHKYLIMLRIMVSQPLGRRCSRLLFYIILIFVSITTISWLRTPITYVSVHEYMFIRAISAMSFVPADIYSQQISPIRLLPIIIFIGFDVFLVCDSAWLLRFISFLYLSTSYLILSSALILSYL